MSSEVVVLQRVAEAVATILDASAAIAVLTGHAAPQCLRLGNDFDEQALPLLLFQTTNAKRIGGLLGSFRVDLELYAMAVSSPTASTLLATAYAALTPLAFAAVGVDAIPAGVPTNADPLDPEDVPFPETFGVATTLTLDVFLST